MCKKTLNNKGVALVTVVLFFLVLVILLGGVMFSSISNQGNAIRSKEHTSAYYVAESGMNITLEKLKYFLTVQNDYSSIDIGDYLEMMEDLNNFLLNELHTSSGTLMSGKYNIYVEQDLLDSELYFIKSIGEVNNVERTLMTTFDIDRIEEELMKAVVAKNSIINSNPGGNPTGFIIGEVASLMENDDAEVFLAGCGIGTVYIPENEVATVNESCTNIEIIDEDKIPVFDETAINEALENYTYVSDSNLVEVDVVNNEYTFD